MGISGLRVASGTLVPALVRTVVAGSRCQMEGCVQSGGSTVGGGRGGQ